MTKAQQKRKLAYEIGIRRIAIVVNAVHRQMEDLPQLSRALAPCRNPVEQRAQLTYFWWLVLGGKALEDIDCKLLRSVGHSEAELNLFHLWLSMLRLTGLPILGEELTRSWTNQIECLIRKSEATREEMQLATAS